MHKKVKVTICSNDYTITTHHDEDYVKNLCKVIDTNISDIISKNSSLTHFKSSILLCLSYLDSYHTAKMENENLTKEINMYINAEKQALSELNQLKEEHLKLKNEHFLLLEEMNKLKEKYNSNVG